MKHSGFLKRLFRGNTLLLNVKLCIIAGLLVCAIPGVSGLETDIMYIYNIEQTSGYYSFILPDTIANVTYTLHGSVSTMPESGNGSTLKKMDLFGATRIPRDRQALLKGVTLWNWITLGSFGINCGIVALAFLVNEPEIGALSMLSHAWFAVSNAFLGNAYYKLNRSLYTYGPEGRNTFLGMSTAYGAVIFAIIGIGIGTTMFDDGPTTPSIIGTSVAAGISNLLGVSAFIFYLFLDKSF